MRVDRILFETELCSAEPAVSEFMSQKLDPCLSGWHIRASCLVFDRHRECSQLVGVAL